VRKLDRVGRSFIRFARIAAHDEAAGGYVSPGKAVLRDRKSVQKLAAFFCSLGPIGSETVNPVVGCGRGVEIAGGPELARQAEVGSSVSRGSAFGPKPGVVGH
jgi:hypothetical protein